MPLPACAGKKPAAQQPKPAGSASPKGKGKKRTAREPAASEDEHDEDEEEEHEDEDEDEDEKDVAFEVHAILAHRGNGTRRKYLVRWDGFDNPSKLYPDTWEPYKNLDHNTVLFQYLKLHKIELTEEHAARNVKARVPAPTPAITPAVLRTLEALVEQGFEVMPTQCVPTESTQSANAYSVMPTQSGPPTEPGAQSNALSCVCSCVLTVCALCVVFTVFSAPSVNEPLCLSQERCSETGQPRAIIARDDGEEETRIRVSPTESALECDFVQGLDGWIFNGLPVIVLDHKTLENGAEFVLIQYEFRSTSRGGTPSKPSNRTVSGWLRSKYVRQLWS